MIGFEGAGLLWLALPAVVAWWLFVRVQARAVKWLDDFVAPRFRRGFSIYGARLLPLHMAALLFLALALLLAAAGPYARGRSETLASEGRVLLLVDGSSSMWANDIARPEADPSPAEDSGPYRRIDYARHVARSLVRTLPNHRFALGSYSGTSVVHLPMTSNVSLIDDALATLEVHSYYRNTGSSLAGALDIVPHFVDRRGFQLQVVLLGDGELPQPEDLSAGVDALATQGIPVHSVAIGSTEGQSRRILNFQDVVDKKENPRVLREYHTRRDDAHLRRISRKTGGVFAVSGEPGLVEKLGIAIVEAGSGAEPFEHDAARSDLTGRFLLFFLIGFFLDSIWFGRRRAVRPARFDIRRLGPRAPRDSGRSPASGAPKPLAAGSKLVAMALLFLLGCALPASLVPGGGSARRQAHRENERGITRDALRDHKAARTHYERSRGFEIETHIPTYNLGRSVAMAGDFSEAHDWFQKALELEPTLAEAFFNDGVTLYVWGRAERDPRNCDLERTRDLWSQSLRRFSSARAAAARGEDRHRIARKAAENRAAVADDLEEVEKLIADPPPECLSDSAESSGAGGGGEAGGGGGGGGEGQGGGGGGGEGEGEGEGGGGEGGGEDPEDQGQDPDQDQDQNQDGGAGGGEGEPDGEGGDGSPPPPPLQDDPSAGGGALSPEELGQIRQQLELLAQQSREPGKYHRRTVPEQFRKGDWSSPDTTIWW